MRPWMHNQPGRVQLDPRLVLFSPANGPPRGVAYTCLSNQNGSITPKLQVSIDGGPKTVVYILV